MKTKVILMLFVLGSLQGQAQFLKKLGEKAAEASKRVVEKKVEEKSERTTSDAVDKTINGKKKSGTEESTLKKDKSKSIKNTKEVKTAKDFVAGDKVLVFEDFSQDAIGDFPVNWLTNSSGEVVTISDTPQRWLKLSNKGAFTITDVKQLPDNFTLEFEVYINEGSFSFYSTFLNIGFIESKKKNDYANWSEYKHGKEGVITRMFPTVAGAYNEGKMGMAELWSFQTEKKY